MSRLQNAYTLLLLRKRLREDARGYQFKIQNSRIKCGSGDYTDVIVDPLLKFYLKIIILYTSSIGLNLM